MAIQSSRPVAGYFGAVAEWLDVDLLVEVAQALPNVDFYLIGHRSLKRVADLLRIPNVILVGEVTYEQLPSYLYAFDVALVPFKLNELTRCTNPVKVYEYLSAGKPVVSTPLPEVEMLSPMVRTAAPAEEFTKCILGALDQPSEVAAEERRAFAAVNTWEDRGDHLAREISALFPSVSLIVLTHNELELTRVCLDSLERYTDYAEWNLILVDNGSSDGTPEYLQEYAATREHVRLIFNEENRGFPAGCNQGAAAADGELLVFLTTTPV